MMERMVCLLIGYVCGNFLTGYLIGKTKDVDIRTVGSGNVGTTNTYRNLGPAAGALTPPSLTMTVPACIGMDAIT